MLDEKIIQRLYQKVCKDIKECAEGSDKFDRGFKSALEIVLDKNKIMEP